MASTPLPLESDSQLPHGLTVFLVEDDEAARHSMIASLERLGCIVRSYCSCEAFLRDTPSVGKGCLLLDFHFIGLSGIDLLELLREARIFIPTVLFTGRFGNLLRRQTIEFPEVVAVLDKPLDGRTLLHALYQASQLIAKEE